MFGTLIICLPSKHTGGAVCLQHGKDSMKLSTAETSAYGPYYLAWYADVTHEVSYLLGSKATQYSLVQRSSPFSQDTGGLLCIISSSIARALAYQPRY